MAAATGLDRIGYGSIVAWLRKIPRWVRFRRETAAALLREWRDRSPGLDHLIRAYERYTGQRGDQLAAAVTFFGFLSFFPLIALAYAVLGYLAGASDAVRFYLLRAIDALLPGLTAQLDVNQIATAHTGAGLLGLAGLLVTGLGWVDSMREALRTIWRYDPAGGGGFVVKKMWDLALVVTLGTALAASVAVSSLATSATSGALGALGLAHTTGAGSALRLSSIAVAVAADTVIYLVMFSRLSGTRTPWRGLVRGALAAGMGIEVLKLLGTYLVGQVARNPVYASFTLTVGLLVWINLVSRVTLLAAAWTATDPGTSPGSAGPAGAGGSGATRL